MSYKMIAIKLSIPLMLAGLMLGNAAWAESKRNVSAENSTARCSVKPGSSGFGDDSVLEFGDMKIKVTHEEPYGTGEEVAHYYVVFDVKAPPHYVKRGIRLMVGESFTDTICGSEVTIKKRPIGEGISVTSF